MERAARRNLKSHKTTSSFTTLHTNHTADTADDLDIPLQCHSHAKNIRELYCGFCEKPICEKCKSTTHARHLTEIKGHRFMVRAAKQRRRHIQKMLTFRENQVIPAIKNLIVHTIECKAKLNSRTENAIRRYQNYAEIHRDKLLIPEEEWVDELELKADKYRKIMDEKVLYLKQLLVDVQTGLQLVQKELDSASHAELLLIFNALRSGLEFLHEPKWPREEILVTLRLEFVPEFGSVMFKTDKQAEKNCVVEFTYEITEPVVYSRVFDTKIPIPKRAFDDENAKISLTSAAEMYASFGEYIVSYTLDNRRYKKASSNISFSSIMSVRDNIIDISCDQFGNLFYLTSLAVKAVTQKKKIVHCFSVAETPSALCVTRDGNKDIYVGFHNAGKICKYDTSGKLLMELSHPDAKMAYRPRHLTLNYINDLFFSDDISNITILDENGIWKGGIGRDVKTSSASGPLRPAGIACSCQRHLFVIDSNMVTNLHMFSEDGKYLQTAVFKNLQDAYVVDIDMTGDVWIAFKDGRIRIYRPDFISSEEV